MTVAIGAIADRTRQRGLCNIVTSLFAIVGFSMLIGGHSRKLKSGIASSF
jgi:hypothetical protein